MTVSFKHAYQVRGPTAIFDAFAHYRRKNLNTFSSAYHSETARRSDSRSRKKQARI